jgi:hypothetical protein
MVVDAMYAKTGELKLVSAIISVQSFRRPSNRNAKECRTCTRDAAADRYMYKTLT